MIDFETSRIALIDRVLGFNGLLATVSKLRPVAFFGLNCREGTEVSRHMGSLVPATIVIPVHRFLRFDAEVYDWDGIGRIAWSHECIDRGGVVL